MCRSVADGGRRCSGSSDSSAGRKGDTSPRREASPLDAMKASMREWRARDIPAPPPQQMSPQMAQLLGCDTPEGKARYERGRALREAGYDGPLDSSGSIPDPDSPAEQWSLETLAALASTH